MKTIVRNPKPKAKKKNPRGSATLANDGNYIHRPIIKTKNSVLKTKKTGNTYKFNPADSYIQKFIKLFKEPGKYDITLTGADIKKFEKYLKR